MSAAVSRSTWVQLHLPLVEPEVLDLSYTTKLSSESNPLYDLMPSLGSVFSSKKGILDFKLIFRKSRTATGHGFLTTRTGKV